jgi:hypothetical protein
MPAKTCVPGTGRPAIGPGIPRSSRRRPVRRLTTAAFLAAATTMTFATFAAGPAMAKPAGGTVGDPQPELAKFAVGGTGESGSGVVLSNGDAVLASISKSGAAINVCIVDPGARKCDATLSLNADSGDDFFGSPEVLSTGGANVSVVAYDCCNIGVNGAVTFNSTDGGNTFGPETIAGSIDSVGAGTVADGQFVVANYLTGGFNVQAFPPDPASPEGSLATPFAGEVGTSALATYGGGVLVASDDLTNTHVEYAASGSDFNSSGSYKHIATISNQDTAAASGSAVLTVPGGTLTGANEIRFFNGTSLGKGYKAPVPKASDDGYWAMQEVRGTAFVFFLNRRASYDVYEETTRNGASWSALQRYGTAITSAQLVPVLGSTGSGLLFEANSPKLMAQPILNTQRVHIALQHSHVSAGHSTKLTGSVSPVLNHQLVTLEKEVKGRWYVVTTTHESASGKFSFTVPGVTRTYRAVVSYKPGYYQYGYSNSVTLKA